MATHSSTLAWKIPWMKEPGRLQSRGSLRVGHDWATSLSLFTLMHWGRKWQPSPVFLPGESRGWWSLGGLPSMGSHRVGHDWSDFAAAAAAHKLNEQGDNMQPWCTPFPIWNQSVVPYFVVTVASWLAYRFFRRQVGGLVFPFLEEFSSLLWSTQSKALA